MRKTHQHNVSCKEEGRRKEERKRKRRKLTTATPWHILSNRQK